MTKPKSEKECFDELLKALKSRINHLYKIVSNDADNFFREHFAGSNPTAGTNAEKIEGIKGHCVIAACILHNLEVSFYVDYYMLLDFLNKLEYDPVIWTHSSLTDVSKKIAIHYYHSPEKSVGVEIDRDNFVSRLGCDLLLK